MLLVGATEEEEEIHKGKFLLLAETVLKYWKVRDIFLQNLVL
jgi:hypothetical protein